MCSASVFSVSLVVELDQAAAGVVDEVVVAVDLLRLDDELGDVAHRADLGLAVQPLPALELGDGQPAEVRAADLAEERRDGLQVVHRDVARDVDRVVAQQLAQEVDLHGLALDVVEDRLGEILRADAIVARVVKPLRRRQLVGERRLADAGHAEQRDGLVRPGQELRASHAHGARTGSLGPRIIRRACAQLRSDAASSAGFADAADAAVAELLRRAAEPNVEVGRELAERRARQRPILDEQRLEHVRILDALRDEVARVRFVAFDERLRRHDAPACLADGDVNVRRAELPLQRVGHGLDRAEVVAPFGVRQEPAVALEVRVDLAVVAPFGVDVGAVDVGLPDLDERVANGRAVLGEQPAGEMRDLADGRRQPVVDDQEIVVGVER